MLKLYDFHCDACKHVFEALVRNETEQPCEACGSTAQRLMPGGHSFTTIIPDYPGSKKLKAGYQHSHADRPKTPGKIQVGWTPSSGA
jgi:putative FmdB family regulatory protein